jgi:DNA repair exonuclease SbcCD ATPase subunit
VLVDKVKDIGVGPSGVPSLRVHIFSPADHTGWTTSKFLTCVDERCGRCHECGNGDLPSENKARIEAKNEIIAEEERIIAEEEERIAELQRAMAEEVQKCANAVKEADAMEHLKQDAECKVEHLETKLLEAEEEVLSLKLKLGEGGEELKSQLDPVMASLNEKVEQSESALADEQTRRHEETQRADDLLLQTKRLQLALEKALESERAMAKAEVRALEQAATAVAQEKKSVAELNRLMAAHLGEVHTCISVYTPTWHSSQLHQCAHEQHDSPQLCDMIGF